MEPVSTLYLGEVANRCASFDKFKFIPTEIRNYEDRVEIDFMIMQMSEDGDCFTETEKVSLPFFENDRFLPLFMRGYSFVWDRADMMFRWLPEDPAKSCTELNPYIKAYDNGELRIDREYAMHNLSQLALRYAFERNEDYIAWNILDHSHIPVMFEIPAAFDYMKDYEGDHPLKPEYLNVVSKLKYYFISYCTECGIDTGNAGEAFARNSGKKLWTPEGPAFEDCRPLEIGEESNG